MLEQIFVKTGGRIENPIIANICAEIAVDYFQNKKDEKSQYEQSIFLNAIE